MDGIDVELDLLSRHPDRMMPILDMKVHVKFIINEHYEKPVYTVKLSLRGQSTLLSASGVSPSLSWSGEWTTPAGG